GESVALERYLQQGGAALLLFDLGFALEPKLAALLQSLGVKPEQKVVVDPLNHYAIDPEMVAVAGYDPHPITRPVSMTFFPGIRPLAEVTPAPGVQVFPIIRSSRDSYVRAVAPVEARQVIADATRASPATPQPGTQTLGIAAEGTLPNGTRAFRAVIIGDGDFASNSFFPYLANSDLALSAVRWLVREERAAPVATRIPVPPMILLTQPQMQMVFLVLVVGLPLASILVGGAVWWRRR
ncbi:MAG: hypothetical protein KIS79_05825, partial [Burkholderiales bacterium]|nr:hypothetical protein [Burkholderiales bacterium]